MAIFGPNSRYAVYEVRTLTADSFGFDREYIVRDAELVSDADVASRQKASDRGSD